MILQILADSRQLVNKLNAVLLQQGRRADPRQLQQLR